MNIHCPYCKCNQEVDDGILARHLAAKGGRKESRKKIKSFKNNFAKRWDESNKTK